MEPVLKGLERFIPIEAASDVAVFFDAYPVILKITKPRKTKLGDYRPIKNGEGHKITINGNLNKYAFLVTLLHEFAHLITWVDYKNKVQPHGGEWKKNFREVLLPFLQKNIFPEDIKRALNGYLKNPKAASCVDLTLTRVLRSYDEYNSGKRTLEELPENSYFEWNNGRIFKKITKLRKRYKCLELKSKRYYLFNPVAEVTPIDKD